MDLDTYTWFVENRWALPELIRISRDSNLKKLIFLQREIERLKIENRKLKHRIKNAGL